MTITDDEREAREWLRFWNEPDASEDFQKHTATILALLDAPRLPHPASVPDEVWQAANETFHRFAYTVPGIQAAYRVLYDHYTKPAEPVVAWAVLRDGTKMSANFFSHHAAKDYAEEIGGNTRIVKLVEAADE